MADFFASPRLMFRQAERHIANLTEHINAFTEKKPWAYVVEKHSDGVQNVHKVKFTEELAEHLPNILFDAANNLRATLDQIAFRIAVAHTGKRNPKSAKFPFGPTEADMLNDAKRRCKDLPPEIVAIFVSLKPYKGGNDALWAMNELCNAPKHKLLYPIAIGGAALVMHDVHFSGSGGFCFPSCWDSAKNEIILITTSADAKISYNFNASFTIALDDVDEIMRGHHPVAVISTMAGAVQEVFDLAEAGYKCIGLIK